MYAFATTIGLGVAGIDPFAVIALLAMIAANVPRKRILAFFFSVFIFTVTVGVAGSMLGSHVLWSIAKLFPSSTSPLWIYANLIVIVALLSWLLFRWYRHRHPAKVDRPQSKIRSMNSTWQFVITGIIYSCIGSISDVTFYGVVVVAMETGNVFAMIGLHSLWFLISQCALVSVFIAYLFNAHKKLVLVGKRFLRKNKRILSVILYVSAGIVIIIFATDIIVYLRTGYYWF